MPPSRPGPHEFLERDAALGLQADVDDGEVLLDGDDDALDDGAFRHVVGAEALVEQGREILARRFSCLQCHTVSLAPAVGVDHGSRHAAWIASAIRGGAPPNFGRRDRPAHGPQGGNIVHSSSAGRRVLSGGQTRGDSRRVHAAGSEWESSQMACRDGGCHSRPGLDRQAAGRRPHTATASRIIVSRVKVPSGSMAKWRMTGSGAPACRERIAAAWVGLVPMRAIQAA